MRKNVILCLFSFLVLHLYGKETPAEYASIYVDRLEDEMAVYFTPENFDIRNDGSVDVSDALQKAINQVQETVKYGIVFIPEGAYRISKTIYLWKGVRLIGYGKQRPCFTLDKNTPGFQDEKKYLFHFTSDRSQRGAIQDANAGTFYSGIRNINFKIAEGNPSAIAVRFHAAQHCFLSHIDFYLSEGNIAVEDICNEIEYCRFFGGDYAIKTVKTSPGWQALVLDSYFEKQTKAAIKTEEAGLTLIRNHFKQVPTAVEINKNRSEELWISDSRLENVSKAAIIIHNEKNPRTQINFENIVCIKVPELALLGNTGEQIKGEGNLYEVKSFTHGLQYSDLNVKPEVKTTYEIAPLKKAPPFVESDVPLLPANNTWVNLKSLGAKGDGISDDTETLEKAIANYQTIYLPGGHYRVSRPIVMKTNTNLVGLHPSITQIVIRDSTAAYQGVGTPVPLLEAPKGGVNIVSGIGLNTSGINPRAVAAKWMAGAKSMMNDVRFTGGHGTYDLKGREVRVYNDNRTSDGISYRKWDTQYWSLWITEGGGGTFKDIWTPSPYAAAGMYISNTDTEGRIYYLSVEHHVRNEVILNQTSNWKIFGLQLEVESGEGPECLPLDIRNSNNLLFVNTFIYRVSRAITKIPDATRLENSQNLTFKGFHAWTWTKFMFDNAIHDATSGINLRSGEFALLNVSGKAAPVSTPNTPLEKLATGFEWIDGATTDSQGNVYFIDSKWHRIYCWDSSRESLRLITDYPFGPISLACDAQDNLIVVTRFIQQQTAFSRGDIKLITLNPNHPLETIQTLEEKPIASLPNVQRFIHQPSRYRFENGLSPNLLNVCFVTPDNQTVIPNTTDIGQTFALKQAIPEKPFYVASSAEHKTYRFNVDKKGNLINPQLFAEEGGLDVAVDAQGNVYIVSDNVSVYDPQGRFIKEIIVPERPSAIIFGGKLKNDLYICARTSLYRIK
jgi:sugar lactone lactonase YvrE